MSPLRETDIDASFRTNWKSAIPLVMNYPKGAFEADSLPRTNAVTGRDASGKWLFFPGKTRKAF
jgi:hypothetical protein